MMIEICLAVLREIVKFLFEQATLVPATVEAAPKGKLEEGLQAKIKKDWCL